MKRMILSGFAGLTLLGMAGCSAFRIAIDEEDPAKASTLTTSYDQKDLINWSEAMAQKNHGPPLPARR